MNKMGRSNTQNLVISYLTLRGAIGILGTFLPFVLYFGGLIIFDTGVQSSLSGYYYTGMGDVFVGTMCVIGFFLMSYKGYDKQDNIIANVGWICALGVALFPTSPDVDPTRKQEIIGYVHLAFAGLLFIILIYFSIFLFTKTHPGQTIASATPAKRRRNTIYILSGLIMGLCIILIVVYVFAPEPIREIFRPADPVFWFESMAIIAFGFSWLVKGETIRPLND